MTRDKRPAVSHRPARKLYRISMREALEAAARFKTDDQGRRIILRFNPAQRIEHQLLILSFTFLAFTGLIQRYADSGVGSLLIQVVGGIEMVRQIHHIFALMFALETIYHLSVFLYGLFVYRQPGGMFPDRSDFVHAYQMLRLNLGLSKEHPRFGRYTFEEKMEYWALVWGTALMGLTGFIQWFPTVFTRWLPGSAIPVARTLHSWEALLAVLAILTWHFYHAVIKHFNKSIFTGYLTEEEMRDEHPAELEYLERAAEFAQRARKGDNPSRQEKITPRIASESDSLNQPSEPERGTALDAQNTGEPL